jgi:hypothetical protein
MHEVQIKILSIFSHRASIASYGYVPSSPNLFTLMMRALNSSETSVLIRATQRNIPKDAILQFSHYPKVVLCLNS